MSNSAEKKAIHELLKTRIKTRDDLMMVKRRLSKKYGIEILDNSKILKEYQELFKIGAMRAAPLPRLLRKRSVRTLSGIAPVAVLTKNYPCPGQCAYCPTEKDVPQSYLSNEPAVMRAIRCNYDPYTQVQLRLRALEANGHEPVKIELIVIGGTWSVLPRKYRYWYIANCFKAANDYSAKHEASLPAGKARNTKQRLNISGSLPVRQAGFASLRMAMQKEQKKNETAKYKIVGLTLETRPDYIDKKELLEMRELGCTRVEIGVQAIDDGILKLNKRGHGVAEIAQATKLLKDHGFKVTYHIMPGLPGSTPAKDYKMFKTLFNDERFQPDQIKFYPTVVTKGSLLYRWWKAGKYQPYSGRQLENLIIKCKKIVPSYVRIIRLIRDIPGESIMAGNMVTNLRQVMQQKGVKCDCIRCREARERELRSKKLELKIIKYQASLGKEYFLQFADKENRLYGFCRLRLLSRNMEHGTRNLFNNSALIRELHVYGELVPVGSKRKVQHAGLGRKLMQAAEKIAEENGYTKMIVISGAGARGYYRKLGYRLNNTYMIKRI